jgi:hypothetical protein
LNKKRLTHALLVLVSTAFALLLCEGIVRYVGYTAPVRARGPKALWLRYGTSMAFEDIADDGCVYSDHFLPHPYLDHVYKIDSTECTREGSIQSRGIPSRYPYPFERDPHYFSVVVLGGSVAQFMSMGPRNDKRIWLEDDLNTLYESPNGKPFRVFTGAVSGGALPIQNNVITLMGDAFDAFVAVDGFNEVLNTKWGYSIDIPNAALFTTLTNPEDAPWGYRVVQWLKGYRRFCFRNGLANRSFLAVFIFERGLGFLGGNEGYQKFLDERINRYFRLPADWNQEKRIDWNRRKYETYIRLQAAQAKALNGMYAHFVQPVHEIDKTLSEDEKRLPSLIMPQDYYDVIVPASEDLRSKGFNSFLLTDVFKDVKETIYADHIHCLFTKDGDSPGYAMMSQRIAQNLGRAWHLKRKAPR